MERKKLTIKSAGMVNGRYCVILSNGDELDCITSLLFIIRDGIGTLKLDITTLQAKNNN